MKNEKIKIIFLYSCFILFINSVFGEKVNIKDAEKVAINFYYEMSNKSKKEILIEDEYSIPQDNPNLYIFNFKKEIGFVIISADDIVTPILCFALNGKYELAEDGLISKFDFFLKLYENQIIYAKKNNLKATKEIQDQWGKYKSEITGKVFISGSIEPMTDSIQWSQGCFYNKKCPSAYVNGFCGNCPVGCASIAMCQIMRYWTYPKEGAGKTFSYNTKDVESKIRCSVSGMTFEWDKMPCSKLTKDNNEIASLCYAAACSIKTEFNYNFSTASTSNVNNAFENYFKYVDTKYIERKQFNDSLWIDTLRKEIDAGRPIYYSIDITYLLNDKTKNFSHACVCDGFQVIESTEDKYNYFFHFNWGWGGINNCYCLLNNLIEVNDDKYCNSTQQIVINIFRRKN